MDKLLLIPTKESLFIYVLLYIEYRNDTSATAIQISNAITKNKRSNQTVTII
jgi:hypothetical protein